MRAFFIVVSVVHLSSLLLVLSLGLLSKAVGDNYLIRVGWLLDFRKSMTQDNVMVSSTSDLNGHGSAIALNMDGATRVGSSSSVRCLHFLAKLALHVGAPCEELVVLGQNQAVLQTTINFSSWLDRVLLCGSDRRKLYWVKSGHLSTLAELAHVIQPPGVDVAPRGESNSELLSHSDISDMRRSVLLAVGTNFFLGRFPPGLHVLLIRHEDFQTVPEGDLGWELLDRSLKELLGVLLLEGILVVATCSPDVDGPVVENASGVDQAASYGLDPDVTEGGTAVEELDLFESGACLFVAMTESVRGTIATGEQSVHVRSYDSMDRPTFDLLDSLLLLKQVEVSSLILIHNIICHLV